VTWEARSCRSWLSAFCAPGFPLRDPTAKPNFSASTLIRSRDFYGSWWPRVLQHRHLRARSRRANRDSHGFDGSHHSGYDADSHERWLARRAIPAQLRVALVRTSAGWELFGINQCSQSLSFHSTVSRACRLERPLPALTRDVRKLAGAAPVKSSGCPG